MNVMVATFTIHPHFIMPITFRPSPNLGVEQVCIRDLPSQKEEKGVEVLQTSRDPTLMYVEDGNGFVNAVCNAYSNHHALRIRPDDVWIAIAVQVSLFIEMHADELRDKFVSHQGKTCLKVEGPGTLRHAPYDWFATEMAQKIQAHVKDPSIRDWVMPDFSTTTPEDRVAGSIVLLSSMKEYFSYVFMFKCGLPEVTLEGTPQDWQHLLDKLQRLKGQEFKTDDQLMRRWMDILEPVVVRMVDSAHGKPDLDWWNRVCQYLSQGSGTRQLTGWITAFCLYDKHKVCVLDEPKEPNEQSKRKRPDSPWPIIDCRRIPSGACVAPVQVVEPNGTEHSCRISAGHFGFQVDGSCLVPRVVWKMELLTP